MSNIARRIAGFLSKKRGQDAQQPDLSSTENSPPVTTSERASQTFPLSFAQQRLWFLDQLLPGNSVSTLPLVIRLTGPLDVAALQQSMNEIVKQHAILRTSFPATEHGPVQIVAETQ